MPWCPKCKTEYEEKIDACSDCGSPLVDELEMEKSDHGVFLVTAGDNVEADRLESLLNAYGIPVLKKYRGIGGYISIYMGNVSNGIDIHVPSEFYETAKGIISPEKRNEGYEEGSEGELKVEEERVTRKRSFRAWIMIIFFMPGLLTLGLLLLRFILYLLLR